MPRKSPTKPKGKPAPKPLTPPHDKPAKPALSPRQAILAYAERINAANQTHDIRR
jgi:hypothetical protein